MFLPSGNEEQHGWYDELQRLTTSKETAVRLLRARSVVDVRDAAAQVSARSLVLHATGDRVVPFEEGRMLAAGLPGAKLIPLESINHILLEGEPAWGRFLDEVRQFLGVAEPVAEADDDLPCLSTRERDVLALVAQGLDNEEIAARLFISVRTVERHLSNVYVKLGVSGRAARAAAAAHYARLGGP
jgi:DNA-binding CsgD family transcriptional regulator